MKKTILLMAVCLCFIGKASAQWVVSDPGNLAQGIINTTKQIVQTSTTAKNTLDGFMEAQKIFQQGKKYYDALKAVHDVVKGGVKVKKSIELVAEISEIYVRNFQNMLVDPNFTPYGVEVTFAKTVHIIFPAAVRYVDLGSNHIIAGKADGAENVIRVKATTEGFPGETNFSVICEDGSFFSFNAKYAREPEMLNIEMKDFLENEDTSDFSHTRMNIYFRELGNESPLLVKLIMRSIYKNNDRKVRHLGSKRFGIQFLIKGIYTYNGMLYVHTQTKNSSNVPFDTDFIKFKIVDKKVPKRTAIQETVLDAVRSYNEVIEIAGKSTVRTVYALPKFTIPDDKLLLVELYEKNGGRHQVIRVENADIVTAEVINELKIK